MKGDSSLKKNNVVLFDVEGTLFDGHIVEGMIRYSIAHRYGRFFPLLNYLLRQALEYPLNRRKLASDERFANQWGEKLSSTTVGGLKREEASEFFRWLVDNYVLNRLRPDVIKILQHHQSQGRIAVLVSGTFRELLEIVGHRLGVFHVVGTRLEMLNGEYTGKIIHPFCFGNNKVSLFKEFINSIRLEVDFTNSFAYADSIYDTPVLEMVGNPVAVYPDNKLRHLALQRGWQIIGK